MNIKPDSKDTKQGLAKRDWLLLAVDAAKPKALTPIQLQKALFLIGQRMPEAGGAGFYKFVPHNFGPFSKQIYDDIEDLKNEGLVDEIAVSGQNWPEYRISVIGTERAQQVTKSIPPDALQYLEQLVNWVEAQSFKDLLQAVYKEYPTFAQKSVFQP
jgi:uncharacterized protein